MHRIADDIGKAEPHSVVPSALNWGAGILSVWVLVFPNPYGLVITILAAVPAVTLIVWLRSHGSYQMTGALGGSRPSLAVAFGVPGGVLAVRVLQDFRFLSFVPAIVGSMIVGAAMTFLMAKQEQKTLKPPRFVMLNQKRDEGSVLFATILLFTTAYAFGAIGEANGLLDTSAPKTYQVTVVRKTISGRYRGSANWNLWLAPWGPRGEVQSETVTGYLYDSVNTGDNVCVDYRPGALHMPWYRVRSCY